jgi:hypothetical protein
LIIVQPDIRYNQRAGFANQHGTADWQPAVGLHQVLLANAPREAQQKISATAETHGGFVANTEAKLNTKGNSDERRRLVTRSLMFKIAG